MGNSDHGACEVARSLQARLAGSHGFGPPMANLDMEPLNIMGDWYQVERNRL